MVHHLPPSVTQTLDLQIEAETKKQQTLLKTPNKSPQSLRRQLNFNPKNNDDDESVREREIVD
ncbi:hypothetical protein RND71_005987 [Anisodus tanguticus]|uniref:Uncharacterized protein n=1 Tax=Anisodus tanguticus TaxID=243964 RepID=A0AAE1VVV9_9SOLA|nr:hypothetical protein RND71_005987 [Anisodus tanguticus]